MLVPTHTFRWRRRHPRSPRRRPRPPLRSRALFANPAKEHLAFERTGTASASDRQLAGTFHDDDSFELAETSNGKPTGTKPLFVKDEVTTAIFGK